MLNSAFFSRSQVNDLLLPKGDHEYNYMYIYLHFLSQSSVSWVDKERQRRDFWQNWHYCCSDGEDADTGRHKVLCPLQIASLGTTDRHKHTHPQESKRCPVALILKYTRHVFWFHHVKKKILEICLNIAKSNSQKGKKKSQLKKMSAFMYLEN